VPRFSQELDGAALLHRGPNVYLESSFILTSFLQNSIFFEWAMLGSNQRPLPCEGSTIVCRRFLKLAKLLRIDVFSLKDLSQQFRRFTRVAARLLHTIGQLQRRS
jgi:hypothetical protein